MRRSSPSPQMEPIHRQCVEKKPTRLLNGNCHNSQMHMEPCNIILRSVTSLMGSECSYLHNRQLHLHNHIWALTQARLQDNNDSRGWLRHTPLAPALPLSPHNHHQTCFISFGCGHGDAGRGGGGVPGSTLPAVTLQSVYLAALSSCKICNRIRRNTVCGCSEVRFRRSVFASCQLMASPRWCTAIWTNTHPPICKHVLGNYFTGASVCTSLR